MVTHVALPQCGIRAHCGSSGYGRSPPESGLRQQRGPHQQQSDTPVYRDACPATRAAALVCVSAHTLLQATSNVNDSVHSGRCKPSMECCNTQGFMLQDRRPKDRHPPQALHTKHAAHGSVVCGTWATAVSGSQAAQKGPNRTQAAILQTGYEPQIDRQLGTSRHTQQPLSKQSGPST